MAKPVVKTTSASNEFIDAHAKTPQLVCTDKRRTNHSQKSHVDLRQLVGRLDNDMTRQDTQSSNLVALGLQPKPLFDAVVAASATRQAQRPHDLAAADLAVPRPLLGLLPREMEDYGLSLGRDG